MLASELQEDFSAGAFPGMERVPAKGVELLRNALLRDDGTPERRGGCGRLVSNADAGGASTGVGVVREFFPAVAAERTVWLYALVAGTVTLFAEVGGAAVSLLAGTAYSGHARPVMIGGMLAVPLAGNPARLMLYGGAPDAISYSTGTASVTENSKTVTGSGTSWVTAGVAAGDVLEVQFSGGGRRYAVVKSVESNTSLTLTDVWPASSEATRPYSIKGVQVAATIGDTGSILPATSGALLAASTTNRLVLAKDNELRLSELNTNGTGAAARLLSNITRFKENDHHLLSAGAVAQALQSLEALVYVFSTQGVWVLSNAQLPIVDTDGNPQHSLVPAARDLLIWGEQGIATWQGAIIMPALEDLFLVGAQSRLVGGVGNVRPVTGGARRLYREYVAEGRQPGQAAVFRGHYLLPILADGSTTPETIATMVWRLDSSGMPFVGLWDGQAGLARALARGSNVDAAPTLFGVGGPDVLSLASCFDPGPDVPTDEDGSAFVFEVTARTLRKSLRAGKWKRVRLAYSLEDGGGDALVVMDVATGDTDNDFLQGGELENLLANPNFEADMAGWYPRTTFATTMVQSAAQAKSGTKSAALTRTVDGAGAANIYIDRSNITLTELGLSVAANEVLAVAAEFRAAAVGRSCFMRVVWRDAVGDPVGDPATGEAVADSAAGWTRAMLVAGPPPVGATHADVRCEVAAVPEGETHYVDEVVVVRGSEVPDYFDGGTVDDEDFSHEWTGAANASTSIRRARFLQGYGGEGELTRTWSFGLSAQQVRFRLRTSGPVGRMNVRGLEVFSVVSGRR